MSFILACDLGATGLKAALMGRDGRTAGIQTVPIESEAKGDVHEIDPLRWWRALVEAVEALGKAQATEFAQVESVAISGIARSQVLIDEHGHSVRPALLFGDMRAGETLPLLRDRLPEENPESRRVSAHHPLARLVWLSEMEPGAFGRVAVVLEPKDYLNFRPWLATGEAARFSTRRAFPARSCLTTRSRYPWPEGSGLSCQAAWDGWRASR